MQGQQSNYDYQQPPYSTGGAYGNQYDAGRKSGGGAGKILLLLGCGGILLMGCCVGTCGVFAWIGMDMEKEELLAQLRGDPVIQQHIGEIESLKINFLASGEEGDANTFIYDVTGSKGSGRIALISVDDLDASSEIIWAELRTNDGQRYTLAFGDDAGGF